MMKLKSIIAIFAIALTFNACWIGDFDDKDVQYDASLIEILCQTPGSRTFCELANRTKIVDSGPWKGSPIVMVWLGQSRRTGTPDPVTGQACLEGIETVFAPSDSAFQVFLEENPQWETLDDIPDDTVDLLVRHHIYNYNKKLYVEIENPSCQEEEIQPGIEYEMWLGGTWTFVVVNGQLAAQTNTGGNFSTDIYSPDTSSTDGIVYIIDKVLAPF